MDNAVKEQYSLLHEKENVTVKMKGIYNKMYSIKGF